MTRAMTLLEVVISLTLLGGVVAGAVSWMTFSAATASELGAQVNWEHAARATLELIEDDLLCGDFPPASAHITVDDGTLTIATRDRLGPCTHEYELSNQTIRVRRQSPRGTVSSRLLLDQIERFEIELDEESILSVNILGEDGRAASRHWSVP
jgi:type II secretory pathway pseudopilin PulG